ncbi:MAG: amino acid permease [Candidatus Dadabacteria bacterium]|nr:amino acid permease [Candidatus Dadabacteria bacterium]
MGTILGAGIYVLIGEVAGKAGLFTPISFLMASLIAAFTAFSYAELSSRYPQSAGEAAYAQEAFSFRWISAAVGWSVVIIGTVSAATIANGFVGYFNVFFNAPSLITIATLVIALGLIAGWGITTSVTTASIITIIEILGLISVIVIAGDSLSELPNRFHEFIPSWESNAWISLALGAFLAFYAFVGFEDIVNVAEEVKNPRKNLPIAIILALCISTLLYLLVTLSAVLVLPPELIEGNQAPLATLFEYQGSISPKYISAISMVAVINGALIQIIMGSRILYGMGRRRMAPSIFSRVNQITRTPLVATFFVTISILVLALWLPLVKLAEISSFITLIVFAFMNLCLIRLKHKYPNPKDATTYPVIVPIGGFLLCICFLVIQSLWGF